MTKITADSTCDLSLEILKRLDVTLAPLYAQVDGESYRDGLDIAPADIIRHVEAGRKVRTAAVNQYDYEQLFGRFADDFQAVIHIALGQRFSACYDNARQAAQGFQKARFGLVDMGEHRVTVSAHARDRFTVDDIFTR